MTRWMDFGESDGEFDGHASVLEWAEDRPLVAAALMVAAWVAVIIALTTAYGWLLG